MQSAQVYGEAGAGAVVALRLQWSIKSQLNQRTAVLTVHDDILRIGART